MNIQKTCLRGAIVLVLTSGANAAWAQTADDGWRWSITPYLWGSGIKADVTFPAGQEIGTDAGFDDILDKLDFGVQAHIEGHREKWGFFIDATYLSMSDDAVRGPIETDAELDTGVYELALVFTPGGSNGQFSAFAGTRIIDISLDMTFTGTGPAGFVEERSTDNSYTDFMVGGRYLFPFNDRWLLNLRGDVGGGDTESSWNAVATVGWRFGADLDNAVLVGWRYMQLEVENAGLQTDLTLHGPIAGVYFGF